MQQFSIRRLMAILCASGSITVPLQAYASAFQLWEQDGASVGNYHAGYAALAQDASISFYNPAGITRFKNQQIVFGAAVVMTDFKYRGSVNVTEYAPPMTYTSDYPFVTAQGGVVSVVPDLHYVAPLNEQLGFGFSVVAPFGLKTDYGSSTPLRYAATLSSITVVDISPSLGFKVTDKASIGVGLDVQKASGEFNLVGTLVPIGESSDSNSTNQASDTAYGYHLGALYELSDNTRFGLSYHSKVVHHLTGSSKLTGPIPPVVTDDGSSTIYSHATTNLTLPPYTAFSVYHKLKPQVAFMGSVVFTQWSCFKNLIFNNMAGVVSAPLPDLAFPSTNIQVVIPQHYRNTWNVSIGADYYAREDITLRGGIGYDQTPVSNTYRNVQLPDNDRYVIALGGHYQATKAIGFDLGWTHLFLRQSRISPPPQPIGGQVVTTIGHVTGGADVFGGQITWTIA